MLLVCAGAAGVWVQQAEWGPEGWETIIPKINSPSQEWPVRRMNPHLVWFVQISVNISHYSSAFFTFCCSSEKIQTLHTELDSVQALRGQLEEVLGRTRSMALALERAAKRQPDVGGGNGQGPASEAAGGILTNAPWRTPEPRSCSKCETELPSTTESRV